MSQNLEIVICMGSSCFCRGNNRSLQILQDYIDKNDLPVKVEVTGTLCEGKCKASPNLRIGGTLYNNVDPTTVTDLLNHHLNTSGDGA